jgi:hypothetical protein
MANQKPIVTPPKQQEMPLENKAATFGPSFTIRLRQHKEGNFSGLWELSILNQYGLIEKMISDADALTYCLENLQGILEDEGF